MSARLFGTDGLRGRVGEGQITPDFFVRLGWVLGRLLAVRQGEVRHQVVIGKDTRISGYMLETALQSGLIAAGADVLLLGPMTTPGVAWLTRTLHASAGLVISASHNHYHDNGLKIFDAEGRKLPEPEVREMERILEQMERGEKRLDTVKASRLGRAQRINDASGRYIEYCKGVLAGKTNFAGMRIVLDCANGATYQVAPGVFSELGMEVTILSAEPNGFNINDKCGSMEPEVLRRAVLENKADLGIAFDGDGDRVLFIDSHGHIVDGDQLLYILASDMLQRRGDCAGVVGTEMSNMGLERALQQLKIPFTRTKVGDRHIQQMMEERRWPLGGEPSGHIICADISTTGDGIATALRVMEVLAVAEKSLDALVAGMKRFAQTTVNVSAQNSGLLLGDKRVVSAVEKVKARLGSSGRVVLRPSGTEPVVRVTVEGEDGKLVHELVTGLADVVRQVMA